MSSKLREGLKFAAWIIEESYKAAAEHGRNEERQKNELNSEITRKMETEQRKVEVRAMRNRLEEQIEEFIKDRPIYGPIMLKDALSDIEDSRFETDVDKQIALLKRAREKVKYAKY